jgi:hypothetical protein
MLCCASWTTAPWAVGLASLRPSRLADVDPLCALVTKENFAGGSGCPQTITVVAPPFTPRRANEQLGPILCVHVSGDVTQQSRTTTTSRPRSAMAQHLLEVVGLRAKRGWCPPVDG